MIHYKLKNFKYCAIITSIGVLAISADGDLGSIDLGGVDDNVVDGVFISAKLISLLVSVTTLLFGIPIFKNNTSLSFELLNMKS